VVDRSVVVDGSAVAGGCVVDGAAVAGGWVVDGSAVVGGWVVEGSVVVGRVVGSSVVEETVVVGGRIVSGGPGSGSGFGRFRHQSLMRNSNHRVKRSHHSPRASARPAPASASASAGPVNSTCSLPASPWYLSVADGSTTWAEVGLVAVSPINTSGDVTMAAVTIQASSSGRRVIDPVASSRGAVLINVPRPLSRSAPDRGRAGGR
jgi:hypothetical protein